MNEEILMNEMNKMKNYTFKLLVFFMLNDNKRFTLKMLMNATGLPSSTLQKGISELEIKNLLHREYVGEGSQLKVAPIFNLTLDNYLCKVEC